MNKLTKVGLSALCGSLASISSANAGEMNVTGTAQATYTSIGNSVTGNPIGLNSAVTFTGSGELDNGSTFKVTLTGADQAGYTSGSIVLTTPSMGKLSISQATGGNGIGGYDDKLPTAWEESWGAGISGSIDLAKGVGSSMNVQYSTPTVFGTTLKIAHAPANTGGLVNDKSVSGDKGSYKQNGWDAVLDINAFGQNFFVGASESERDSAGKSGTNADGRDNHQEGVAGVILSFGPLKIGAQATAEYTGETQVASAVMGYKNVGWGASFNVNDNLSVSYATLESKKGYVGAGEGNEAVKMIIDSYQIAYTMGGATLKWAETDIANSGYSTATTAQVDGTTIALSLAF